MSIGDRIAELRKNAQMSQFQLAKVLGIGTSTLGMYETDKRKPSPKVLEKMADYFSVSTDYLLGRKTNEKAVDLADKDALLMYMGKPVSDEDKEMILRLMRGKEED